MNPAIREILMYVAIGLVIKKVLENFGLLENPKDTKGGQAFRALPELRPQYYKNQLKVVNFTEGVNKIFTIDDKDKVSQIKDSISRVFSAKGIISDDEDAAVNSIMMNVESKIQLSMYAEVFERSGFLGLSMPFVPYLDTYLENTYQRKLLNWAKKLPVLTAREKTNLERFTGKKVSFEKGTGKLILTGTKKKN